MLGALNGCPAPQGRPQASTSRPATHPSSFLPTPRIPRECSPRRRPGAGADAVTPGRPSSRTRPLNRRGPSSSGLPGGHRAGIDVRPAEETGPGPPRRPTAPRTRGRRTATNQSKTFHPRDEAPPAPRAVRVQGDESLSASLGPHHGADSAGVGLDPAETPTAARARPPSPKPPAACSCLAPSPTSSSLKPSPSSPARADERPSMPLGPAPGFSALVPGEAVVIARHERIRPSSSPSAQEICSGVPVWRSG